MQLIRHLACRVPFVASVKDSTVLVQAARRSFASSQRKMPPYPAPVPTFHNSSYPAFNPIGRATGRVVVITGASGGVGRDVAVSFAKAGAREIVLLGRSSDKLVKASEAVKTVSRNGMITTIRSVNVTDVAAMEGVAKEVGAWDVLVCAAGTASKPAYLGTNVQEWWDVMEASQARLHDADES